MLSSIFIIDGGINIQAAGMHMTAGCSSQLLYRFLLSEHKSQEDDDEWELYFDGKSLYATMKCPKQKIMYEKYNWQTGTASNI